MIWQSSTITMLGTGHSESLDRYNTNALVSSSEGRLLIDCGYTIKYALAAQALDIADIDAIFITHVHGDHVFGLERIAYEAKFKHNKKINLCLPSDLYTELWDHTLKGSLHHHSDGYATLQDYFDVMMIDSYRFHALGHSYELFPVSHTPNKPAYGLLIDKKILYSGDTRPLPETIPKLDFQIGFHDVTFSDHNPVHAPLNELIESYPSNVRNRLLLVSYEDSWPDHANHVRTHFLGLAEEGIPIAFDDY